MNPPQRLVVALRILLGAAFAALLLAQIAGLPAIFRRGIETAPELAHLHGPMLTVSVLGVVCFQVVIVCTWRLLTLVERDRIFSDEAFVWVDTIVGAVAAAWLLLLGSSVYVVLTGGIPALPAVLLMLTMVAGAVLGLLMIVMRALLRQATQLRTDMEAVI